VVQDEIINNYIQMSKYDLDRADLRVKECYRIKAERRRVNN